MQPYRKLTPLLLSPGRGAFSCAVAKASRGGQNSHRTRQWTQRRGHRLRSTNGCSTGRSTGTATHTVSGHGTPAHRRRQRRRERFPNKPPQRKKRRRNSSEGSVLSLPGCRWVVACGAVAVGRSTRDGRFRRWGSFPGARLSGSWPTLDLHYVRWEVRPKSSSEPPPWPLSEMTVSRHLPSPSRGQPFVPSSLVPSSSGFLWVPK